MSGAPQGALCGSAEVLAHRSLQQGMLHPAVLLVVPTLTGDAREDNALSDTTLQPGVGLRFGASPSLLQTLAITSEAF